MRTTITWQSNAASMALPTPATSSESKFVIELMAITRELMAITRDARSPVRGELCGALPVYLYADDFLVVCTLKWLIAR